MLTGLGIDEYFQRTDSAGSRDFLTDTLGSTLALADSSGAIQTSYTYEPFGHTTVSGASSTNPFQFTGRENDTTGLYYYPARYYSPSAQRFVSQDPLGFAGGSERRPLSLTMRGTGMTTERIEINPAVMMGKPVIRGTRITVELILGKLAEGETEAELIEDYPHLKPEDIRAAIAYGAASVAHEEVVLLGDNPTPAKS